MLKHKKENWKNMEKPIASPTDLCRKTDVPEGSTNKPRSIEV